MSTSAEGRRIDLNADLGEGLTPEHERALMQVITSASIACGGHAGDRSTMRRTLVMAGELGLRVGAHPSYPDREGFGRVSLKITREALRRSLEQQMAGILDEADALGLKVEYFKPHGALYNDALRSADALSLLLELSSNLDLPIMLLAGKVNQLRLPPSITPIAEAFIDRAYGPDGTLIPRGEPGALIKEPAVAAAQALTLASTANSLCIHSDSPSALELVRAARVALEAAGHEIGL